MAELHTCVHCGEVFEREHHRTGPRPTVCDTCNPRSRYKKARNPDSVKAANARYREKRRAIKQIYREIEEGRRG